MNHQLDHLQSRILDARRNKQRAHVYAVGGGKVFSALQLRGVVICCGPPDLYTHVSTMSACIAAYALKYMCLATPHVLTSYGSYGRFQAIHEDF